MLNVLGYSALTIGNNEGFQKIKTIEKIIENAFILYSFNLILSRIFKQIAKYMHAQFHNIMSQQVISYHDIIIT